MRAQDRIWVIGAAVLALVAIVGGWFLGIQPQLATADTARSDESNVEMQNTQLQTQLNGLKRDKADMSALDAQSKALEAAVPSTLSYSTFVRELDALAASTGVKVTLVESADAAPYVAPTGAAPAASSAPTAEATAAPEATATPDPSASTPATGAGQPAEAPMPYVSGSISEQNLVTVPISIQADGDAGQLFAFLHAVQLGSRQFSVTTVSRGDESDAESTTENMRIEGFIYVLQTTAAASAGTTGGSTTDS